LFAALSVLVIAIGLSFAVDGVRFGIAFMVTVFGIMPAVVLAALLGWFAGLTGPMPVWLRRFVLGGPALLLVSILATELSIRDFLFAACLPTALAAVVLERVTRVVVPSPVPVAQARRAS
jgi:hypothetical protein